MKKTLVNAFLAAFGLMVSGVALAQGAEVSADAGMIAIGAAIAVGLSTFAAASAQARAATTALEGIARNPGAKDQVFQPFIIGLVFMEFQALLGFVISILWTFKV